MANLQKLFDFISILENGEKTQILNKIKMKFHTYHISTSFEVW